MSERAGLQLYLLNTLIGSVLGVFSKLAARDGVPFFELVLVRSIALVACTIPLLVSAGINPFGRHDKPWLLILRGVFGFLAITFWYWALALLPMSDVNALGFLSPIFVALLGPHVLGEPTSPSIYVAMLFSMAGVVLVAQPSWILSARSQANSLGVAVGLAHALFSTGAKLTVRALASAKQPMADIVFSFGFISLLGSSILCASMPHAFVLPPQLSTWLYIAAACALGYAVQVSFTSALQKCKAAPAAACDYLSMLWTLLADWLVFRRLPSNLSLVGAAIICGASLIPVLWGWHGGSSSTKQQADGAKGGAARSVESEEAQPLKLSSSAEPEVQLAKIKYLGKGNSRTAAAGRSASSECEALGLVAGQQGSSSPQEKQQEEDGAWEIPAARPAGTPAAQEAVPPDKADGGLGVATALLQQVLLAAPTRTSSEKEAALRLAGK